MVRAVGIGPTLLAELDFESNASTNSTTPASLRWCPWPDSNGHFFRKTISICISLKLAERLQRMGRAFAPSPISIIQFGRK